MTRSSCCSVQRIPIVGVQYIIPSSISPDLVTASSEPSLLSVLSRHDLPLQASIKGCGWLICFIPATLSVGTYLISGCIRLGLAHVGDIYSCLDVGYPHDQLIHKDLSALTYSLSPSSTPNSSSSNHIRLLTPQQHVSFRSRILLNTLLTTTQNINIRPYLTNHSTTGHSTNMSLSLALLGLAAGANALVPRGSTW